MIDRNPPPAADLGSAYRACSPRPLPPDHGHYVDLGPAREGNLRPQLERRFRLKGGEDAEGTERWPKVLFLGMRGSGKSTELNYLAASLRDRFEVVSFEVDARLNASEFDLTELVLAVAVEVERHLREAVGAPLPAGLLGDIQAWFASVTHEDVRERVASVEASARTGLPDAAGFFGSVMGLLKSVSTERTRVVESLRRFPGELVTLCNRLLRAAEDRLEGGRELLLILDNLDRYPPEVVDRALGGGADHFLGMQACVVLTPPVDLIIRPLGQPLSSLYPHEVMHVPRLRRPDEPPGTLSDPGHGLLRELLARRVDLDGVMAPGVPDALIGLSGGHPRLLLDLTREAILRCTQPKLDAEAVEAAVKSQLTVLRDQVNSSGLAPLIARVHHRQQLGPELEHMRLLFNRWVFKHDGEDWYAVNPLVLRVPEVRQAIAAWSDREGGAGP